MAPVAAGLWPAVEPGIPPGGSERGQRLGAGEFERHLAGCNPCQVVVDNVRKTITLDKSGQPYELPAPFRERLHRVLRKRWKETQGTPGDGKRRA